MAPVCHHRELPTSFFGYVITHAKDKIYVTQSLFQHRWSVLREPLGMQLQNYFGIRVKSAQLWQILRAVLDVDDIASL
jgi:hypothetical protein